jgi:serine protease DegQ
MRRLWLLFAEFVTVTLAIIFVITLVRPDWTPWRRNVVEIRESAQSGNGAVGGLLGGFSATALQGGAPRGGYTEAAKKAMVSVVNISASRSATTSANKRSRSDNPLFRRFFGLPDNKGEADEPQNNPREGSSSLGSGVIVNADAKGAYILTNDHVVQGFREIKLALADGRVLDAKITGTDPETDLAVLRVEGAGLTPIVFAQSDKAQVGDSVLAVGDPFGVGQTVTMGIVSALGRNRLGVNAYENFIQTDAAINPGNSGGALVDINGNLLGINSVIYSQSGGSLGIGFAIPATMAKDVMEQIIANGAVTRGYIGISPQDLTPEIAKKLNLDDTRGAYIARADTANPAYKAGLRVGDVITAINGKPVQDSIAAMSIIAALKPNATAVFSYIRSKKAAEATLTVGKRPARPVHIEPIAE